MHEPLISVIVPVYRAEDYLDRCLKSITGQSCENLEIILVDDGSPDNCPQMCDAWAQRDARIRVIHQRNGGASAARNAGLDAAQGRYIGFVDSDDYIAPDMYETLIGLLQDGNAMASCRFIRVAGDECQQQPKGQAYRLSQHEAIDEFLKRGMISDSFCDKLFEQRLFKTRRFPVGETNEEYTLFLPLLVEADGVAHVEKPMYFYRMTEGSVTDSAWQTDADIVLKHLKEMQGQLKDYGLENNQGAFAEFAAMSAYSTALLLEKNRDRISGRARENLAEYVGIMRRHCLRVMLSGRVSVKDKLLYILIVTKLLRPVYKALGKL